MAFNQLNVINYPNTNTFTGGAGLTVALASVTSGSYASASGLVIPVGSPAFNIEFDSLCAVISAGITTSSLTATTVWQGSNDDSNWLTIYGTNGAAYVQRPATGTGTLVTTTYAQKLEMNPSFKYLRMAVLVGGTTGASGDNVTVGYCWRKRWIGA